MAGSPATPEQILKLVKAIDAPNFGVNLDTGNFHGDDPYAEIAELAPYAVNVQVKTEIQRNGAEAKEEADLARLIAHPPRRPLLRLRRPRVRGRRGPAGGHPEAHQEVAGTDPQRCLHRSSSLDS